ncbi:MAG: hypothetical protein JSS66_13945 [Armatimonadetes bacterium]|nr:hypothetical protein [Armatimonadota bacterium]
MPFEPLQTDETVSEPAQKKKDFESQLMAGCTTIGVVSLLTYGLTIWPFSVFPEYTTKGLTLILIAGCGPAMILGAVAGRTLRLAGASGFFGGAMAGAVFMHLRLQQTLLGKFTRDLPKPDYADWLAWAVPPTWFVAAGIIALVFYRREPNNP